MPSQGFSQNQPQPIPVVRHPVPALHHDPLQHRSDWMLHSQSTFCITGLALTRQLREPEPITMGDLTWESRKSGFPYPTASRIQVMRIDLPGPSLCKNVWIYLRSDAERKSVTLPAATTQIRSALKVSTRVQPPTQGPVGTTRYRRKRAVSEATIEHLRRINPVYQASQAAREAAARRAATTRSTRPFAPIPSPSHTPPPSGTG